MDPIPLLEEALRLFQVCLALQEGNHTATHNQQQGMMEQTPATEE